MFASRLFVSAKALTLWIVMASYLASLAAKLTNRPLPVQVITDWTVFAANDWTLCVKNESVTLSTMQSFYPSVPIQPIGSGCSRWVVNFAARSGCMAASDPYYLVREEIQESVSKIQTGYEQWEQLITMDIIWLLFTLPAKMLMVVHI